VGQTIVPLAGGLDGGLDGEVEMGVGFVDVDRSAV